MEQQKDKLNIAILSPNENAYSETFIQAHKDNICGEIYYYYGGFLPQYLENYGLLRQDCTFKGVFLKILNCLQRKKINETNMEVLRRSFKKSRIDVVLAEYGVTAAESLDAIKKLKIPLVVHFHGFDAHNNDIIQTYRDRYREVFKYAAKVVVVSQYMKDQIIKLGCPLEKIVYAPYGPNEEYYEVSPVPRTQQFFAVGRFVDKKAPYYTILAFKRVLDEFPDACLKMAGDGPLLSMCKNLVKYLGIANSVNFIGVIGRKSIKREMSQSLAFVQHSIVAENGDSEGTPVAVLEAGAAGLPVIATRHAGIRDVVIEGETGILVDEHDVAGMTKAMKRLLRDATFARELGTNARKRIRESFSMNEYISTIEKILRDSVWNNQEVAPMGNYRSSRLIEWNNKVKFVVSRLHKFLKKCLKK